MAGPGHLQAARRGVTLPLVIVVPDSLEMLVTGDPVAEIDAALARASARLRAARAACDTRTVMRLTVWIDYWLDQRLEFDYSCRQKPTPRL
jgi:hypothetical protein